MTTKTIYIQWTEQQQEFLNWRIVPGGLGTEPVFKTKTIKRKACYSRDFSPEMVERAKQYIQTDMQDRPDAKVIIVHE